MKTKLYNKFEAKLNTLTNAEHLKVTKQKKITLIYLIFFCSKHAIANNSNS